MRQEVSPAFCNALPYRQICRFRLVKLSLHFVSFCGVQKKQNMKVSVIVSIRIIQGAAGHNNLSHNNRRERTGTPD